MTLLFPFAFFDLASRVEKSKEEMVAHRLEPFPGCSILPLEHQRPSLEPSMKYSMSLNFIIYRTDLSDRT